MLIKLSVLAMLVIVSFVGCARNDIEERYGGPDGYYRSDRSRSPFRVWSSKAEQSKLGRVEYRYYPPQAPPPQQVAPVAPAPAAQQPLVQAPVAAPAPVVQQSVPSVQVPASVPVYTVAPSGYPGAILLIPQGQQLQSPPAPSSK